MLLSLVGSMKAVGLYVDTSSEKNRLCVCSVGLGCPVRVGFLVRLTSSFLMSSNCSLLSSF